jgi:hypothetical protein
MSGTITTGSAPRLLQLGVKAVWDNANKAWEPTYPKMFKVEKSKSAYELTVQMSNMGLAGVKNEGDDIQFDSTKQLFAPKFVHVAYGKGFVVTREAIDDNKYNYYSKGAKALNHCMNVTREVRAHVLYNTAFSSSSAMTGGDGVAMISTAHLNGNGGTYANRLAIDANFSEAALEDMLKLIMRAKDDRGLARKLRPMKLIGHTDQMFDFDRVLNSNLRSGTAENDLNAVKGTISGGFVLSPYLDANTKSWFIMTDADEGMTFYDRTPLEFGEDKAFTSDNMRYKAYMRFSTGYSDPQGIFGSEGQ